MIPGNILTLSLCLCPLTRALHLRSSDGKAGKINEPCLYQSPRFRWWWPGGWIKPKQVTSEIKSILDAGFGGAEIGDVRDSLTEPSDPKVYGWGQDRWNNGVAAAYKQSNRSVLQVMLREERN